MSITVEKLSTLNLGDVAKCDGTFTIDSKLVLSFKNDVISFAVVKVLPYKKKYPSEKVDYESHLSDPKKALFLAYIDGAIAGELRIKENWNKYACIEDLVVDAQFRRQGIGRALIAAAVRWATQNHFPGIILETQNNNVSACLLYQSCGFEIGGFDQRLYQAIDPRSEEIAIYWYLKISPL